MAAPVALVAIRHGRSAVGLGKRLRSRVRASGLPICRLMNLIAGADVHVGAVGLVVRVEVDMGAVADVARIVSVSAVSGAVAARRNGLERDRVGWERCLCHVSLPELVCTRCVPIWTVTILVLRTGPAKLPKLMPPD